MNASTPMRITRLLSFLAIGGLAVLYSGAQGAFAANFTNLSTSISDPRPSQASVTYTTVFTFPSTTALQCIAIRLASTPSGSYTAPTGLSSTSATKGTISGGGLTNANWTLDATTEGVLLLTSGAPRTPTTTAVTIPIDAITNPSGAGLTNGTFFARVNTYTGDDCSTGPVDSGVAALAVTSGVVISGVVDPSLSFTLAGLGSAVKTSITPDASCVSSATAVSYPASMNISTTYYCAQRMTVSTNGAHGYSVTARGTVANDDMVNSADGSKTIDDLTATNASPDAFGTPTEGFGYTTSDGTLGTGTTGRFSSADTFAKFTNVALEVAYDSAPVAAQTTDIAYGFRFGAVTDAGIYSTTIVYTATPIF